MYKIRNLFIEIKINHNSSPEYQFQIRHYRHKDGHVKMKNKYPCHMKLQTKFQQSVSNKNFYEMHI